MASARAKIRVHGRVQGVWYRGTAQEVAERLGLRGWVANRRDGTVEAVAEGDKAALEKLIKWCYQGPPLARVTQVDVEWEKPTGEFIDFGVRYIY